MTTTLINKASSMEAKRKLFDMVLAFVKSQCIYTATRLGRFNLLEDEGEESLESIAQKTDTKPERLYFVLRALAHLDVRGQMVRVFTSFAKTTSGVAIPSSTR